MSVSGGGVRELGEGVGGLVKGSHTRAGVACMLLVGESPSLIHA